MQPDGTEQHRLVEYWGHLESPSWSSDGHSIAMFDWHHQLAIRVADVAKERFAASGPETPRRELGYA